MYRWNRVSYIVGTSPCGCPGWVSQANHIKTGNTGFTAKLDFWGMSEYNSNNLKHVGGRSTGWKGTIFMALWHQVQKMDFWQQRTRRFSHPIDGPGAVFPKSDSSSSH